LLYTQKRVKKRVFQNEAPVDRLGKKNVDNSNIASIFEKKIQKKGGG
jgi:hypothetical protein